MVAAVQFSYQTGATTYFLIRNASALVWNTNTVAFETFDQANYLDYAIAAVEQSPSGFYAGTFPSTISAGVYSIVVKNQVDVAPLITDPGIANGDLQWNGASTASLADVATSGQLAQVSPQKIYRGEMVQNFPFKLVSSADHITPFTSGNVSGQISRDGSIFGPLQSGAYTEMGKGWFALQALTSGDLLANTVALVFTATGISGGTSDQRDFSFLLNRTSGYS